MAEQRPPLPPFTEQSAREKVQAAEDAWNTRDPERVSLAYTVDSEWRNRDEFFKGREAIVDFLRRKWERELDYRLRKELWCFTGNRISVRFEYESHDRPRPVVAEPRQRALGVRRERADAASRREHQRLRDRGARTADRRLTARALGRTAPWIALAAILGVGAATAAGPKAAGGGCALPRASGAYTGSTLAALRAHTDLWGDRLLAAPAARRTPARGATSGRSSSHAAPAAGR